MLFDQWLLPQDTFATDKMDSARLAGIMVLVDHPKAPWIAAYIVQGNLVVRHPYELPANNPLNCTRDQILLVAAALHRQNNSHDAIDLYEAAKSRGWRAQNTEADIVGSTKPWYNGADALSPSHKLHLALAAGYRGSFIGYSWLAFDIVFNAIFTPTREPNQLLAQVILAGPKWVRFYKKVTPKWRQAISDYWIKSWRGEAELGQMLIDKIESM